LNQPSLKNELAASESLRFSCPLRVIREAVENGNDPRATSVPTEDGGVLKRLKRRMPTASQQPQTLVSSRNKASKPMII
jgi:hypothetical protein